MAIDFEIEADTVEFTKVMNALSDRWPALARSQVMFARYLSSLKGLPHKAWWEITNQILDTFSKQPTPKDISEIAKAWRRANRIYSEDGENPAPIAPACTDCYETGYVFCKYNPKEPTTLCFCACARGQQEQKDHPESVMPVWKDGNFQEMGFVKVQFPVNAFKPKADEQKLILDGFVLITDIKRRWQAKVASSHKYWSDRYK